MADDLFSRFDSIRRDRLRSLGWLPVPSRSCPYWKRPDGAIVTEDEAFEQLENQNAEKASAAD